MIYVWIFSIRFLTSTQRAETVYNGNGYDVYEFGVLNACQNVLLTLDAISGDPDLFAHFTAYPGIYSGYVSPVLLCHFVESVECLITVVELDLVAAPQ
jgi:hypothetical protein